MDRDELGRLLNLGGSDMESDDEEAPDDDEWSPPDYKSPPRVQDEAGFHSGDEHETRSPTDRAIFPLTIEPGGIQQDTPLHSVSWKDESHPMWVRIRTVMDSGAADSVAPPTLAPQVEIRESPGSKRGQCYVSASAGRMPNMGEKVLNIQTNEGKDTIVFYQIA